MKLLLAIAAAGCALAAALGVGCGGTEGALPGAACGGRAGGACRGDEYCDFGNNRCGADDVPGVCRPRPTSCPVLLLPERTCGCDGVVHPSLCDANLAGADVNAAGTCPLEAGTFACGFRQCNRGGQYCQRTASDVADLPDEYACLGLPASCGSAASCACLAGEPCGASCTGSAAEGLALSCPGG